MRIVLTGASGLIGSAMARRFADHEVVTVGRRKTSAIQVDLADPQAVAALDLGTTDALIHCAGVVDEDFRENPEKALKAAVFGADALVRNAVAAGARRLVYLSSAHSYGPFFGHIDELSPPNPVSDYAIAHFATEQVFRRQATGEVAGLTLRPCAVFGDLPDPTTFRRWSLIPFSFPRDAEQDNQITIRSTGEQRRNFVGTDDIAETCAKWLDSDASGWAALNPIGSTTTTVYEFAQLCASISEELSGVPCTVTRAPVMDDSVSDDFEYSSTSPMTHGAQDLRATLSRLMTSVRQGG